INNHPDIYQIRRDLNFFAIKEELGTLFQKNLFFSCKKTLKNAGEVSYTSSLNQLLFNQSKVSLQTSGILPI
ncbi:unnamed protein product, partial [marine sediment metagenome]